MAKFNSLKPFAAGLGLAVVASVLSLSIAVNITMTGGSCLKPILFCH